MIKDLFQLLRPHQWVKNGIVLAGLIFSGSLGDSHKVAAALIATGLFCLLSSAVYVINDLADAQADRNHPTKAKRPIASGRVKPGSAILLAVVIGGGALAGAFFLQIYFFYVGLGYFVLNLLYTFWLKHIVIIDVMSIATGFVLRALAGAVVIGVDFSGWLLISSFLLALFLGFGKRRNELVVLDYESGRHRKILKQYSEYYLDQLISVVTPAVVVCYLIYVISPDVKERLGTEYLFLTVPFVIYGVFRYLYLIHLKEMGGNPTRVLLSDAPILITVLLWLATAMVLLYVV